jgi:hypothetical protein
MSFTIYDDRLNVVPSQIEAKSWDEMERWATEHGLTVGKRRTEWSRAIARVTGIEGNVVAYTNCFAMGGIRATLVEKE